MKDFSEVIHNQQQLSELHKNHQHEMKIEGESSFTVDYLKTKIIKMASPFLLSVITGPFTTMSILLQISEKPAFDSISSKLKSHGHLQKHINNGIFGDNRIYNAVEVKGYRDGLGRLGKEGLKGMYKGNLTGIILAASNGSFRSFFYQQINSVGFLMERPNWKQNIATVVACTLADFLTLPLMVCQSRLILQNSSSNFRTYKHLSSVLTQVGEKKMLFAGASLLLFKNICFSLSWITLIKESPVYSFAFSTLLSHFILYPFSTIIRNLQTNQKNVAMMHNRTETVRVCAKRIWGKLGIMGFYRGFLGYSLVHLFLGVMMLDMNLRTGYFDGFE